MSHRPPIVTVMAFQLSAALEHYQQHMDALDNPWSDRAVYEQVSAKFDEIRMIKGALPELSVLMVEVLIAHVELMEALWLAGSADSARSVRPVGELRQRHSRSVQRMQDRCVRIFSRSATS